MEMTWRRRSAKLKSEISRHELEPEEVLDVHSVHDSSPEPGQDQVTSRSDQKYHIAMTPRSKRSQGVSQPQYPTIEVMSEQEGVVEVPTDGSLQRNDDEGEGSDLLEFEDVEPQTENDENEELDMENVDLVDVSAHTSARDLQDMYAAAYHEAQALSAEEEQETNDDEDSDLRASVPIYKDGKGQHKGVEISMGSRNKKQDLDANKKKSTNFLTPRDRQNRIHAHKLYVLSILAHTQVRNKWCNDQTLRDHLADSVPEHMYTKLRTIHPKKVTEQRERVRMFESFLIELVRWWAGRFRLDVNMTAKSALRQPDQDIAVGVLPGPGRSIDGWLVESAAERDDRHKREQKETARRQKINEKERLSSAKGKGKASGTNSIAAHGSPAKTMEITIFAPGSAIRPVYLRLLPCAEPISSAEDLLRRALARSGSRETSAQLFCALCRSLGIPARLVVSPQPMPWSVGASKLANTAQPQADKKPSKLRSTIKTGVNKFVSKPLDEYTSDEDDYNSHATAGSTSKQSIRASSVVSGNSSDAYTSSTEEGVPNTTPKSKPGASLAKKAVLGAVASSTTRGTSSKSSKKVNTRKGNKAAPIELDDILSDTSSVKSAKTKSAADGRGRNKAQPIEIDDEEALEAVDDTDYRPEKWRNLKAPLEVEHKVKLRAFRPNQLKSSDMADDDNLVEPVDLQAPPTMWVEVFSKPYQKWISVDPVRSLVRPSGNRLMEPSATERKNKFVYVVAFEEDGYARDVTARYTKTLNSRVSRLRPPTRAKGEQDWWSKVALALHRPQKLDRDAMEDAELQDHSSREPMPSSMAGFKDHPLYFLEKNLKRDEVIFPRRQIATFQGTPVFSKSDVLALRSSRQWFNEGRVVKDDEVALKFVKSRGYTLANKRAEEQARSEGREVAQEGLYADFQTKLYVPPAVGSDGTIPTNGFGNIDLFVPSMLPAGAVHLPFTGVAKVARKLGIPYAEAITGFEFRKQRGMPKITGIVVAEQSGELVEQAFWQQEQEDALKQQNKRMERAMKNWRKLINALRIAKRVQEQYRDKMDEDVSLTTQNADTQPNASPSKSKYFPSSSTKGENAASLTEQRFIDTEDAASLLQASPTLDNATNPLSVDSSLSVGKRKIISMAQLAATTPDESCDDMHASASSEADEPAPLVKRSRLSEASDATTPVSARASRRKSAANAGTSTPKTPSTRTSTRKSLRKRYAEDSASDVADNEAHIDGEHDANSQSPVRKSGRRITVSLGGRRR